MVTRLDMVLYSIDARTDLGMRMGCAWSVRTLRPRRKGWKCASSGRLEDPCGGGGWGGACI